MRISAENAERLVFALIDFGFAVPELTSELFLKEGNIIRMGRAPLRIEIATSISGVSFDGCYAARQQANLDGVPVPIIGREHLLANKRAAGRARDLADVEFLSGPPHSRKPRR